MSQLDLFGHRLDLAPGAARSRARLERRMRNDEERAKRRASRPSLDQRYAEFASKNPHVFRELLRLATARLDRGETYISVKALWEELRTSLEVSEAGGDGPPETTDGKVAVAPWKLNNDYTALYARALLKALPRLEGVMHLRERKAR